MTLILLSAATPCLAQVCRLSVAGLNRDRRVIGAVNTECPSFLPFHSVPFGNWGVTSNFGAKRDGLQFEGWCRDQRVFDNDQRSIDCGDRWYEWNSCTTDHGRFRAPNCDLFNAPGCREQVSPTGINVVGTRLVEIPVSCPADNDHDGVLDAGGCSEIVSYSHGTNFMSLYEIDPATRDQLVQTLIYPESPARLDCDARGCAPSVSDWFEPTAYDDPTSPPLVFAEMAMLVNFATFADGGVCGLSPGELTAVSAADYSEASIAPDSIASLFGSGLSAVTVVADSRPLPTELGGIQVRLTANGREARASILFVSPNQINFIVPAGFRQDTATLRVVGIGGEVRAEGHRLLTHTAPALFSADASASGPAAALVARAFEGEPAMVEPVFTCGEGSCFATPIVPPGPRERVVLMLFGTGIRGRTAEETLRVTVGGQEAVVTYAGPQPEFDGLDQVNAEPPPEAFGGGLAEVVLTLGARSSNAVLVRLD